MPPRRSSGDKSRMSTQQTYTKVASVGDTLVAAQELLPVEGIVETEKADVLLLLRGHDGVGAAVSNGSGGDWRIGRSSEGRNNLGIVIGICGGCAECALPSGTGIVGLLVLCGRCRGDGCRRENQVRKCSVEPHDCCFGLSLLCWVSSVLFGSILLRLVLTNRDMCSISILSINQWVLRGFAPDISMVYMLAIVYKLISTNLLASLWQSTK